MRKHWACVWVAIAVGCGSEDERIVHLPAGGGGGGAGGDAQVEASSGGTAGAGGELDAGPDADVYAPEASPDAQETGFDADAGGFDADAKADAADASTDADASTPTACDPVSPLGPTSGGVDCAGCWAPGTAPPGYGSGGAQCDQINQCGNAGIKVGSGGFSDWTVIFPKSNEWDGGNPCPVSCQVRAIFRFDVVGSCVRFTSSTSARRFSTSKAGGCIAPLSTCLVASAGSSVYVYASSSAPLGWVRAESVACSATCP